MLSDFRPCLPPGPVSAPSSTKCFLLEAAKISRLVFLHSCLPGKTLRPKFYQRGKFSFSRRSMSTTVLG